MTDVKLFFKCFSFGLHFSLKNENYIFNSFTVCKTVKKKNTTFEMSFILSRLGRD